jgi:general secretion pathway protein H
MTGPVHRASTAPRGPHLRSRRGLTLVEITVALAIIAVLFAAVVIGVGALTGAKAKQASTDLGGTIRALYDTAALSGKTCRLVFELPEPKEEDGAVTWRAECAKGNLAVSARRDEELKDVRASRTKSKDQVTEEARFRRLDRDEAPSVQELQAREKARVEEVAKFSEFSSGEVASHTLPPGVRLEVWTSKQRAAVKSGPAFLYFFPQGYTERARVWVRQGTNVWTLTISPLTGKTVIHAEDLEVPRS